MKFKQIMADNGYLYALSEEGDVYLWVPAYGQRGSRGRWEKLE